MTSEARKGALRSAHTDEITRRMFIATADRNYLLARIAHLHALDVDFWWLGMHAVEKYLKAILLLNGRSAKGFGHDLIRLVANVRSLDRRITFGPFTDPAIEGLHWRQSTADEFLERLNGYGSAANRYLTYGYTVLPDDLVKIDQLVWSIRRLCRRHSRDLTTDSGKVHIDEIEQLRLRPARWSVGSLPLEHALEGRLGEDLRLSATRLNVAFAPDVQHVLHGWRVASDNPPLGDWLTRLRSAAASEETRETAANVLHWALENIQFDGPDRKMLLSELESSGF